MRRTDLRKILISQITDAEWDQLEHHPEKLVIGEPNRETILRMRKQETGISGCASDQRVRNLDHLLRAYLKKYMADQPEGHKWIILACLYLAEVERLPMHPAKYAGWVKTADGYECPLHSGEQSICGYCICKKRHTDQMV